MTVSRATPWSGEVRFMLFKEEADRIEPYLPANYICFDARAFLPDGWQEDMKNAMPDGSFAAFVLPRVERDEPRTIVIGTDYAGWTFHEYLAPRMASGLLFPLGVAMDASLLVKNVMLEVMGKGFQDEISGDVEADTGHFVRINRYLITTNSQGFTDLYVYVSEQDAMEEFASMDADYGKWMGDEEDDD